MSYDSQAVCQWCIRQTFRFLNIAKWSHTTVIEQKLQKVQQTFVSAGLMPWTVDPSAAEDPWSESQVSFLSHLILSRFELSTKSCVCVGDLTPGDFAFHQQMRYQGYSQSALSMYFAMQQPTILR